MNIDRESMSLLMARVRPWAAVAAVAALVMFGYLGYTGNSYKTLSGEATELETTIAAHNRTLDTQVSGDEDALAQEAEAENARVQATIDRFSGPVSSNLLALVAGAAERSGLQPSSLAGSGVGPVSVAGLEFSTDSVAISMTGAIEDLGRFLDTLRLGFPGTTLVDMQVVGLEGNPTIQTEIVIHHSPRMASTETN